MTTMSIYDSSIVKKKKILRIFLLMAAYFTVNPNGIIFALYLIKVLLEEIVRIKLFELL